MTKTILTSEYQLISSAACLLQVKSNATVYLILSDAASTPATDDAAFELNDNDFFQITAAQYAYMKCSYIEYIQGVPQTLDSSYVVIKNV